MTTTQLIPEIPRESTDWLAVEVTETLSDGSTVPVDKARVGFAVLVSDGPSELRPGDDDWAEPVDDPGGGTGYGVQVSPADDPHVDGIWVRIDGETVLDPDDVGYLIRS